MKLKYNNRKWCSYFRDLYHTTDKCSSKYKFPPWYKQINEKNEEITNNIVVDKIVNDIKIDNVVLEYKKIFQGKKYNLHQIIFIKL